MIPWRNSQPNSEYGQKIKFPTSVGSQKKEEHSRKTSASLWITTCHGKFLELGISDHLTCLLRTMYAGQEATVRTRRETVDWVNTGKGVHHGYILSPCLFNFCAENSMWNARLYDSQTGIKIARRNISNLRYADATTLLAESEEELKILLMRVKEESEKSGLKLNIQKMKIMASGPITSWQIDGETMETVTDFTFLAPKSL